MRNKSLQINAILNIVKSLMAIIFPLISFPYISRVLDVEMLGKINYSSSLLSYFILIAGFGITSYAIREGSKVRNEKDKFSQFSFEIIIINLITTIFSYVLLFVCLIFIKKFQSYKLLCGLYSINLLNNLLSCEWVNNVYEDYAYITIRSILMQLLSILAMFILVKMPKDYLIYVLINVLSNSLVSILNIWHIKKYFSKNIRFNVNFCKHLSPLIVFFISSLAMNIYINIDITMVGWLLGDYSTGLYSASTKIYTLIKTLVNSLYVVSIARLSYAAKEDNLIEFRQLLTKLCNYILLLVIPIIFGIFILSDDILIVLSGKNYLPASLSLKLLSISLLPAVFAGIVVNCMNTCLNKESVTLKATIISSLINLILNFIAIPYFGIAGAAITTIISEIFIIILSLKEYSNLSKLIEISKLKKTLPISLSSGLFIVIIFMITKLFLTDGIFRIVIVGFSSVIVYSIYLFILKNEYFIEIITLIKNIFFKKYINFNYGKER